MTDKPQPLPLASFVDLLLDAICVVDMDGRFVSVSAACERIFGYTPDELVGRNMLDLVLPEDHAKTRQAAAEVVAGQSKSGFENRYLHKDGHVVHIMWSARWSEADQVRVAVARDITERKRTESLQAALYRISEAAHASENVLALFQRIHQIVGELLPADNFSVMLYDEASGELRSAYHVDLQGQVPHSHRLDANTACAQVMRTGQTLLLTPESRLAAGAVEQSPYWLGVPLQSCNGTIGAMVLQGYAGGASYSAQDQELLQFVSTQIADAIERKQLHSRLQFIARHDPLTGLPNRALLADRLSTALARARREQGRLALLYLDLDKFKEVNDNCGHAAGDLLLQVVALRLRQCVRESDTVARIGGDEFVILLESIQLDEHAWALAEKIRNALNQPFDLGGYQQSVLPSIGMALYPEHGDQEQRLLQLADEAMYVAKRSGGNRALRASVPAA
ncbi:MAG: diguanylate cyclase [Pseudomonas sp.]|uniref:diguanylate cyclase domain-containing protein n=1 Tax=Pseudomonas sp. TaxID=306 RepID=UPI003395CF1C